MEDEIQEAPEKKEVKQSRLCSEIQLFDLCSRDVCNHRDGRYCTKGDILAKFEAISEDDDRSPEMYMAEEMDDVEGAEDLGFDDAFGVDEYEDEGTEEEY